jgi:hypothetical protein
MIGHITKIQVASVMSSCTVFHLWFNWSLTLNISSELLWTTQWGSEVYSKQLIPRPAKQLSNVQDIFQFVPFRSGKEWTHIPPPHHLPTSYSSSPFILPHPAAVNCRLSLHVTDINWLQMHNVGGTGQQVTNCQLCYLCPFCPQYEYTGSLFYMTNITQFPVNSLII